ncbi:MAG: DUF4864 domain-containing protein [Acidobacteria bacterium]|nr:DUF4864 domain-containing protein [Acidobacteriota bacterium]
MEKKQVVLIVTIVVVVLVVFGALFGGIFWWVWKTTGEPVKVIRTQLEAINQGDYARAHSYFSAGLRAERSAEDFQAFVEANAAVFKTTDSTFSSRKIQNDVATIRGTLTGQSGQVTPIRYTLVVENGRWVIASFRFGDLGAEEDKEE